MREICNTSDFVNTNVLTRIEYFHDKNLNLSKCVVKEGIETLTLKKCQDNCNRECHFSYYSYTIDNMGEMNADRIIFDIKHNLMPDLQIEVIPEMTLMTFVCNFGGILGMWLGVSFFSIFDRLLHTLSIRLMKIFNLNINNLQMKLIFNERQTHFRRVNQRRRCRW